MINLIKWVEPEAFQHKQGANLCTSYKLLGIPEKEVKASSCLIFGTELQQFHPFLVQMEASFAFCSPDCSENRGCSFVQVSSWLGQAYKAGAGWGRMPGLKVRLSFTACPGDMVLSHWSSSCPHFFKVVLHLHSCWHILKWILAK